MTLLAHRTPENVDDLELYPGLHAEGHSADGLGEVYDLLRIHTMRNGLLFDAIALVIFTEFLASLNGYLLMGGFRFVVTAFSPTLTLVSRCRTLSTRNLC